MNYPEKMHKLEKKYNRIANFYLILGVLLLLTAIYFLFEARTQYYMWILSMVSTLGSIVCTSTSSKYDKKYRALRRIRKDKEHMGEDYVSKPPVTMYAGTTTYSNDYDLDQCDHE